MTCFPGTLSKQPIGVETTLRGKTRIITHWACRLTAEQEEWLRRWFPTEENKRLMRAAGMTRAMLERFAKAMHLQKNPEAVSRHAQQRMRRIHRENPGRSAYLRNDDIEQRRRESVRRMWQDVREGRRSNPSQLHGKAAEQRRKTCRKSRLLVVERDRRRLRMGLEAVTNVKFMPYTSRQRHVRSYAIQIGYVLASDCSEFSGHRYTIYYDENTVRRPRFEANLHKSGFTLRQWEE